MNYQMFKHNRTRLFASMPNNSMCVFPSAVMHQRTEETNYPFHQDCQFFHLTGFNEPNAVAVLTKNSTGVGKFILFCLGKDQAIWSGKTAGPENAVLTYGANVAYNISFLDEQMPGLIQENTFLYADVVDKAFNDRLNQWLEKAKSQGCKIEQRSSKDLTDLLRLLKTAEEIDCIRKAANTSALAHLDIMSHCKTNISEAQLRARFSYVCALHGECSELADLSVIAGGANAVNQSYNRDNAILQSGDLVKVQAAAAYNNYTACLTRTLPVNGKFTREQKAAYNVVLAAQQAGIAQIKPGKTWKDVGDAVLHTIVQGLIDLKILHGNVEDRIADGSFKQFFPDDDDGYYSVTRSFGLDVYEENDLTKTTFAENMVLRIEPSLTFDTDSGLAQKWTGPAGTCIKLMDTVVVTKSGNVVLTDQAPRTPEVIEAKMAAKPMPAFVNSQMDRNSYSDSPYAPLLPNTMQVKHYCPCP